MRVFVDQYVIVTHHALCRLTPALTFFCCISALAQHTPLRSNLRAAVEKVDITAPAGILLAGYGVRTSPSTGVHDPLRAGILIMDDGTTRAAIITLDWVWVHYGDTAALRAEVSKAAGVPETNILIAASHTHGSPSPDLKTAYTKVAIQKIAGAASVASHQLRLVSVGYAEDSISFNVNRRFPTPDGRILFKANPNGPVDHRVKVLRIDDAEGGPPIAVLMHAVCHPNVFRAANTQQTADFAGLAQSFVERIFRKPSKALFLQGCDGDIRANFPGGEGTDELFRDGDEADMQWASFDMGAAAVRAAAHAGIREEVAKRSGSYRITVANTRVFLPAKKALSENAIGLEELTDSSDGKPTIRCDLQALRVGSFLFVALPGEPMVEIGFEIEKHVAGRAQLFPVGYANGYIGYIPTAEAYKGMGYEPASSPLTAEAEDVVLRAVGRLVDQVLAP